MGYPIPKVGLLEERPAVSGGAEKTQREELRCKLESDAAEGPVCEDHDGSVGTQFGKGEGSFDSGSVSVPRD